MANIDRRKVTMVSVVAAADGNIHRHEAIDYVAVDHLDAYVADAKAKWQSVTVGEDPDHGPAGEHGHYKLPAHL